MMKPTCPKPSCDSTVFRLSPFLPENASYKLYAVHCARCGAVIGVQEVNNISALIIRFAERMGVRLV